MTTENDVFGVTSEYLTESVPISDRDKLEEYAERLEGLDFETSIQGPTVKAETGYSPNDHDGDNYQMRLGVSNGPEGSTPRAWIEGPAVQGVSLNELLDRMPGDPSLDPGKKVFEFTPSEQEVKTHHLRDDEAPDRALEKHRRNAKVAEKTGESPTQLYSEKDGWYFSVRDDYTTLHLQDWNPETEQVVSVARELGFEP